MTNQKKLSSYDYFMAVQVSMHSSYIVDSYDNIPDEDDAHEKVEKVERWEGLSKEAKTVIQMILGSPAEILELIITPTTGRISKESKKKLFTYFRKQWGWKTKTIFEEIEQWVESL